MIKFTLYQTETWYNMIYKHTLYAILNYQDTKILLKIHNTFLYMTFFMSIMDHERQCLVKMECTALDVAESKTIWDWTSYLDWVWQVLAADCILLNDPVEYIAFIWRHHLQWRLQYFGILLWAYSLSAGRDLYRATPAVTRGLGFCGLIR